MLGHGAPAVGTELLVDVPQAAGDGHPLGNAEAHSHGLASAEVGVLPDDHHLAMTMRGLVNLPVQLA